MVWRDYRLIMSALAKITRKSFIHCIQIHCKKVIFRSGIICNHIADDDFGSLKSPHTLLDKCLDHIPMKFEQSVDTILEKKKKKKEKKHFCN